jgi:hypothetical protein
VYGPITAGTLKNGKLTLRGNGSGRYPLMHAPQGRIALRLSLGSNIELCAEGPAKSPATTNDTNSKFAAANAMPPTTCPAVPQ